jgi:phosphate/sulfate permease
MRVIILGLAIPIVIVISFLIGYEDFSKAIAPFIGRMRRS